MIVRNKLKSRRYFRSHPRVGYLPVQTVDEGVPIETRSITPSNAASQSLHSHVQLFAQRYLIRSGQISI